MPNKLLSSEELAYHYYSYFIRLEIRFFTIVSKETARGRSPGCQKHKQNKVEPYGDLAEQAFYENLINNPGPHSQIENDKTPGAEYLHENDVENTETNKSSAIPNFMPKILPDDEIAKGVNSLNSKQREVFNVINTWVKDYVKYDGYNVKPVLTFLSGSGGTISLEWCK